MTTPDERGIRQGLGTLVESDARDLGHFAKASRQVVLRDFRWETTTQTLLDACNWYGRSVDS